MTDTFGALQLPAQLAVHGEPAGDPGLGRLGQYFKSTLNFFGQAAWTQVAGPNLKVVSEVFFHDPNEMTFNNRDMPGLFISRFSEPAYQRLSEDIDLSYTKLKAIWVRGYMRPEFARQRDPFYNTISKVMQHAIELGRHPSYVMADDPDPTAATQGSVIMRVAGCFELIWKGFKRTPVTIQIDREKATYAAFDGEIELIEQRTLDIVADFPAQKTPDGARDVRTGLDLTFTTPDGARDLAVAKL